MATSVGRQNPGTGSVVDALWRFDNAAAVSLGNIGANVATDVVNLGTADKDIGTGTGVRFVFKMAASSDSADDQETVQFQIVTSENADLSSGVVIASTAALAQADLTEGTKHQLTLPEGVTLDQYIGVQAVVATSNTTAGTYWAYVEAN
jgi:hypothetical protein